MTPRLHACSGFTLNSDWHTLERSEQLQMPSPEQPLGARGLCATVKGHQQGLGWGLMSTLERPGHCPAGGAAARPDP